MKMKISKRNPFGYNRHGFIWEVLGLYKKGNHLDYGAYDGKILKALSDTGKINKGTGVDLDKDVIESSIDTMPENVYLLPIEKNEPLPFGDKVFDSISISEVIEHVNDQDFVLGELNRVLKDDGIMLITVPQKHALSFMDIDNFKFLFPNFHRWIYIINKSSEEYKNKYKENQNGMFGNFEVEKQWHQHFSKSELGSILNKNNFEVLFFDGAGLLRYPLLTLKYFFSDSKVLSGLCDIDSRFFSSTCLFCIAKKKTENEDIISQ